MLYINNAYYFSKKPFRTQLENTPIKTTDVAENEYL